MDAAAPTMYGPPQQRSGGGSGFIVVLLLCVISVMAGAFFYVMKQNSSEAAQKIKEIEEKTKQQLAAAKSEEEKREIQRKANLELEKAKLKATKETQEATMKLREEQLKRAEARVESEMKQAKEKINEAKKLKEEAAKEKANADLKEKEAQEAMKKAQETNDANAKKLAEETKRIAEEAQKKVDKANKKAREAIEAAKKEARAAIELKERLEAASAKIQSEEGIVIAKAQGDIDISQKGTVVRKIRKEEITVAEKPKGRESVELHISYDDKRCRPGKCQDLANAASPINTFEMVRFNGDKPQHFLFRNTNTGKYCYTPLTGPKQGTVRCDLKDISDEDAYRKGAVFGLQRSDKGREYAKIAVVNDDREMKYCDVVSGNWECKYDEPGLFKFEPRVKHEDKGVDVDLKTSKKPMKFALYDGVNCTGKVIRSMELDSNIELGAKLEIKSQKGDQQKACCMKTENVKIVMGEAISESGDYTEFKRTQLKGEKTTNLPGCPNDYRFSITPLE